MATMSGNMSGLLEAVQILDVLQLINSNGKTGKLTMTSKDRSINGFLKIVKGEVYNAECGSLSGEDAAYELLALESGRYAFISEYLMTDRVIHQPFQNLVMEAAKILDSKRRLLSMFPNPHAVPYALEKGENRYKGAKLYAEDKVVAAEIDGYNDFEEITAITGYKHLVVLQTAAVLLEANKIGLVEPRIKAKVEKRRSLFFKAKDIAVSEAVRMLWNGMPPYKGGPDKVKLLDLADRKVLEVNFDSKLRGNVIAIPEDRFAELGIQEGDEIWLKPSA